AINGLLKASEFTCMSPDATNAIKLQSLLTCREPSRNNEDEKPSTKFARLLPRFWKGNERYLLSKLILHQLETHYSGKYDSDFASNLSSPQLCEDEDMKSDVVVSSTLKTRNGRQIKAVVRLNL
ncbi:unnamed protein product, partial [Porites evermanni]